MAVSDANKRIAKAVDASFGGGMDVVRFYDEAHKSHVDILSCVDRPQDGVTSRSTVGLSDSPLYREGKEFDVRVEFVGACYTAFDRFSNVLASAAFNVINSRHFCAPGTIFPGVVARYFPESPMRHLMFTPPFLWKSPLSTLHLPEKTVAWLLTVPISDAEMRFAEKEGPAKLEELFEQFQIDVFNIERESVV